MKKNILTYGLISGGIVATLMLISMNYISHCEGNVDYGTSMLIGYASMIVAFSLVYVGIRNYRNNYSGGVISFGKAFKIGILMVLIASTMYVAAWLIDFYFFNPDFFEKFSAQELASLRAKGASQVEIADKTKEMADMARWTKNPVFHAAITYAEILPVGIIVSLICALILKKKPVKLETAVA